MVSSAAIVKGLPEIQKRQLIVKQNVTTSINAWLTLTFP